LSIFNHWPGYPPFWNYLREVVLVRDGHRCQVTGCPSRLELHIHHKKPVSKGGAHIPENLVALCDFHHALEPDAGHERIWATIKTRYFTLVRSHTRSNRANPGTHSVNTHLRRLELVSESELENLKKTYGFSCPHCNSSDLVLFLDEKRNIVQVTCRACEQCVQGPQELTEETGPRLAEILKSTKFVGQWTARWDMLSERKKSDWGDWEKSTVSKRRRDYQYKKEVETTKPVCPKCGSPMRVIQPKPGDSWKPFWGCTQFRTTGCKGSAKLNS
jgi:ssDNA-binding Zn-finger/Zn-ribbon topoisomerase 1